MKVTKLSYPQPIINSGIGLNAGGRVPSGGNDLQVLTSNGSNGRYWGENVRRITSNGSNTLLSPDVNFANGANITFAISSNTLTISGTGGGGGGSGAPTTAPYVTTASDATLTAEKVRADLYSYSPDNTPATTPAVSDEFADGSFTGWSWDSTPATADEATYPGFLYVDGDSTERHLNRAWTPGAVDITLAARFMHTEIPGGEASTGLGIYVGDATGNPANSVLWQIEAGGTFAAYNENGAGTFVNIFSTAVLLTDLVFGEFYLMIQRTVSGPTWRFYWSATGLPATWHQFSTTGSKSLTIAAFGIRADTDGPWAVDWIRAWDSLVTKVGS